MQTSEPIASNIDVDVINKIKMDIVYVIGTTAGMQPFINVTLDAVKSLALSLTLDSTIRWSLHFGLWCYRDALTIPGIEYRTKNFTPTLQPIDNFEQTLQGMREATVDSGDLAKDVFSGLNDAIRKTAWTPNALHFIILVGDAPGHEVSHPWNYSGQSAETLRLLADDNDVYIFVLHPREPDPRLESLHPQNRHLMGIKHNIRPLYALLSASL
jgi:hypothetical protein